MKNKNKHLKVLTLKESKNIAKKAQHFIMQRIRDIEIIQGRKLLVEPILIDELEYYVVRSWLLDKEQMAFDVAYTKIRVNEEKNLGD